MISACDQGYDHAVISALLPLQLLIADGMQYTMEGEV